MLNYIYKEHTQDLYGNLSIALCLLLSYIVISNDFRIPNSQNLG